MSLSYFMPALLKSFASTVILDVVSLLILTFLLFIQIGKPIIDTSGINMSHAVYETMKRYNL